MNQTSDFRPAEEQFRPGEMLFRALVDNAQDATALLAADGTIRFASPAVRRYGCEPEMLVGRTLWDLVHPDDLPAAQAAFAEVAARAGHCVCIEHRSRDACGRWRNEQTTLHNLLHDPAVRAVVVHLHDVTDLKQTESDLRQSREHLQHEVARRLAELQDSEARYRRLIEALDVDYVFYSHDREGQLRYVSPSVQNVLGYTAEEILQTTFRPHFTDNPINASLEESFQDALAGRRSPHRECEMRHADGSTRILEYMRVPVLDPLGRVGTIEGIARDVTARRRAEQQLQRTLEELEQRVDERTADLRQLNLSLWEEIQRREQAEQRLLQQQDELAHASRVSIMGEMVAAMGHEIGQPLHTIATFASAAQRALQSDHPDRAAKVLDWSAKIQEQVTRADGIIRRLREFTRPDPGHRSPHDIDTLVQKAVELSSADLRRHGVQLDVQRAEDLPRVTADPLQIEQVLVNLFRNAAESMRENAPQDRRLIVATAGTGEGVQVSVRDSGCGVSDETLGRLFQAFFTTKAEGTGIGLAISRRIIEEHGGSLHAERNGDRGMTFTFKLPASAAE